MDCGVDRFLVDPLSAKGLNSLSEAKEGREQTNCRGDTEASQTSGEYKGLIVNLTD